MKLLFILMAALMLPIVPALACFPEQGDEVLFASEGRSFDRSPIPMSFCESGERSFVVVNGKCYDQDAITDYDTEEECDADPVCKAYREDQKQREEPEPPSPCDCPEGGICEQLDCGEPIPGLQPKPERTDDPNHGEIIGDEELTEQDEEEHQEEEEQGQEEPKETTAETSE